MYDCTRIYIDGQWRPAAGSGRLEIVNPATEQAVGTVAFGSEKDVDDAVAAARRAFETFAVWTVTERLDLLEAIDAAFGQRLDDIAQAITAEMGAPAGMARRSQAASGRAHLRTTLAALKSMALENARDGFLELSEPVGVCGLITPWNWPINQISCKVAPALAAGCTVVLKPSEIAPIDAGIFAEVLHEAGVPAGVFNLVHGDGPGVGAMLSAHPGIDMVSFTGSTRAGRLVAKAAADTVKRVAQELGGKSPNLILDSAPLRQAVEAGTRALFHNTGQSCNAPSRMLVPVDRYDEAVGIAADVARKTRPGDPRDPDTDIGPLVSETQWNRVQALIEKGLEEGAVAAAGGSGKPDGLSTGYYVRPTVFRDVHNGMTIAREEVFGPVLCVIPYSTVDEGVAIANDSDYGLSGYVWAGDRDEALAVARRLRTGMVHINGASTDAAAPFGGYKQSGNGREWGVHGIAEYLETKAVML